MLKIKKEFEGMILSRFDMELGMKITMYPGTDEKYFENFKKRGFNIFEEVDEDLVIKKFVPKVKRKYTKKNA